MKPGFQSWAGSWSRLIGSLDLRRLDSCYKREVKVINRVLIFLLEMKTNC